MGPDRRRPQILDATLKLAAERGLSAVNMEVVAQSMGVSKPVIYACFGSREELLNALLEREEQRLFEGVMNALPKSLFNLADPERMMSDGFRALFSVVEQHSNSWRLILATENDPAVSARHRQARQLVAGRVAVLAQAWLRLRRIEDRDRRLPVLVDLFMAICEGMVRSRINGQPGWSVDELARYVGRLTLGAFEKA